MSASLSTNPQHNLCGICACKWKKNKNYSKNHLLSKVSLICQKPESSDGYVFANFQKSGNRSFVDVEMINPYKIYSMKMMKAELIDVINIWDILHVLVKTIMFNNLSWPTSWYFGVATSTTCCQRANNSNYKDLLLRFGYLNGLFQLQSVFTSSIWTTKLLVEIFSQNKTTSPSQKSSLDPHIPKLIIIRI